MKAIPSRRILTFAGTSAILVALLTGCAAQAGPLDNRPEPEAQPEIFEFQHGHFSSEGGKLQARLPEKLLELFPETMDVLITGVTIKPHKLDSASFCAVDFEPEYATGGAEKLFAYKYSENEDERTKQKFEELLQSHYDTRDEETAVQRSMEEWDSTREEAESLIEDLRNTAEADDSNPRYWYGLTGAFAASFLDEANPMPGTYLSDDYTTMTTVGRCAASPSEESVGFYFPYAPSGEEQASFVASFQLSVMKSGTIAIINHETGPFVRDTEGNWIVG